MRFIYPVKLKKQRDTSFLVTFPDVPEAITDGADRKEALREAEDVLVSALGGYISERREIPRPSAAKRGQSQVFIPPLTAAKLALYQTMREQGITNTGLAKKLCISEGAVRRLINLDHRSQIEKIEQALELLGKRLIIEAA